MSDSSSISSFSSLYSPLSWSRGDLPVSLLTLHPGKGEDRLGGTISVIWLSDQCNYEALSYTWGESTLRPPPTIILNEHYELQITDNLFSALRRLRRRFRSRRLWIDALCINQTDLDERIFQVSIMGAIYNSAFQVCVWLGEMTEMPIVQRLVIHSVPLTTEFLGKITNWQGSKRDSHSR